MSQRTSYEYYDENYFSSISYTDYRNSNYSYRREWKYNTDGNSEAYYHYRNGELLEYVISYYSAPSGNLPVSEAVTRVWSSGGRLYIDAATAGAAQIYALSGQLLKTVALTGGQTTSLPLQRGLYIVVAGGKTWKVIL
jgi:hypothetical protein